MARITVQDCLEHVENRFSLVLITAERTKQLIKGADGITGRSYNNKEIVIALREVAAGIIKYHEKDPEELDEHLNAAEIKRAVQMRQATPPDSEADAEASMSLEKGEEESLDEKELDDLDEFPEEDLDQ